MHLYGLKNCDSCRKALKLLNDTSLVDVRSEGMPLPLLEAAFAQFGDALLNTRSTTWRGLDAAERERPVLALLADHPALMKRPLIVDGEAMYLGWDAKTRTALGVA